MLVTPSHPAGPQEDRQATLGRNARLGRQLSGYLANRVALTIVLVLLVLAGLPVAVWLDLRNLSERALREQADDLSTMIDSIRNYYSNNVVGRVLAGDDKTHVIPNYTEVRGAIPIPATLSLELGDLINAGNGNTQFRFFSDYRLRIARRTPSTLSSGERWRACGEMRTRGCATFRARFLTAACGSSRRSPWLLRA